MGIGESLPVGPGFLGFLVTFVLVVAVWLLLRNMNTRMRRMAYNERARLEQDRLESGGSGTSADQASERGDRASDPDLASDSPPPPTDPEAGPTRQ